MKIKLVLFVLFFTSIAFGQLQNNIWCFGDHAGLDFNSGTPVVLASTGIYTSEGCSSIADNTGNLLFYSDGVFVYNRNHIQMPNGFGLLGHPSTTQSALIVPKPGSATLFYIFCIDDLAGAMVYSMVDMTLAGGFGDVVVAGKNTPFHPIVAEKQQAILRCDSNIWIISHEYNSNNFFADLITPAGINATVISGIGSINQGGGNPTWNSVGYMKVSQQGNRIAMAIRDAQMFELFDFDVNTGIVSNPVAITSSHAALYGVEFSPNGNVLYGSSITSQQVYQFNLLAGNAAAIAASSVTIPLAAWGCALQLATNGKIYVAEPYAQASGNAFMGVINSPNTLGASCNYLNNAVNVGPNTCLLGLPNMMIRSTIPGNLSITGNTSICSGQSTTLTATGGVNYQWSGGSNATTAAITVSPLATTTYYLESSNGGVCIVYDTVIVQINPAPVALIAGNTTICAGQSTTLTASGAASYQWSGGSAATKPSITVSPLTTTTYSVTPSNGGCVGSPVNITVNVTPLPVAVISSTVTSVCSGQTATLTGSGGTTYQWSGGSNAVTPAITVTPAATTTYSLQVTSGGCSNDTTLTIQVNTIPVGAISGNQNICSGQTTLLTASGATSYQWSGGSTATTATITVSPLVTTTYTVTPSNGGCVGNSVSVTVTVTPTPNGAISASSTSICTGQSVTLTASGGGTYQWSGGASSILSTVNSSPVSTTTYYLQTSNGTCIDNDSIVIQVMGLSLITGNQVICAGQTTILSASGATSYQWSGGSNANTANITVAPLNTTSYYVTGTSACGSSMDTAIVVVNPGPAIDITNTYTTIFTGGSVQLNATGGVSYIWTAGSSLSCNNCPDPIAYPTVPVTYIVTGTDAFGCTGSDTVTINPIVIDHQLYMPNCITPNEDGTNDIFFGYGINIKKLTMRVFDRWGELIFESDEKTKGWDGTMNGNYVQLGVYVYTVHCEWIDGVSDDRKGIVTVFY